MTLRREYFPSDTIKLINESESLVVRGAVRAKPGSLGVDDKYAGHTIGRHLLKESPGALGRGIERDEFRDRFLRSSNAVNSGWAGKGEMAVLLCELLNSTVGQYGLGQLDRGSSRVAVNYVNKKKFAALYGGLVGSAQLKESRVTVTPSTSTTAMVPLYKRDGSPVMVEGVNKYISKRTTTPRQVSATVTAEDIAAVFAVLDRFGRSLHLQTFFPSSSATDSYVEWRVVTRKMVATLNNVGSMVVERT